jgi:trigger factor
MGGASEMNPQIDGIIDQVLSNPEEKQKIFNDIQDEKLIKLFKENISSKKKSVTKDKFIEIASKID